VARYAAPGASLYSISSQQQRVRIAVQTRDEAKELIAAMRIMSRDCLLLVWPACSSGARLRYADLANNYDALWYPSSDDVWVTDTRRRWLLELHHEEVFSWYEPMSESAS
jgi:hypothetical protein